MINPSIFVMVNTIFLRGTIVLVGLGIAFASTLSAQEVPAPRSVVKPNAAKTPRSAKEVRGVVATPLPASLYKRTKPLPMIKKPEHILALDFGSASLVSNTNSDSQKVSSPMGAVSYEWRPNAFGIKVTYASASKFHFEGSTPFDVTISGPMLGVTGRYMLGRSFALTAEGGVSLFSVNIRKTGLDGAVTESTAAATRGYGALGVDYEINNAWALRLKYSQYASDFSHVSVGLSHAF